MILNSIALLTLRLKGGENSNEDRLSSIKIDWLLPPVTYLMMGYREQHSSIFLDLLEWVRLETGKKITTHERLRVEFSLQNSAGLMLRFGKRFTWKIQCLACFLSSSDDLFSVFKDKDILNLWTPLTFQHAATREKFRWVTRLDLPAARTAHSCSSSSNLRVDRCVTAELAEKASRPKFDWKSRVKCLLPAAGWDSCVWRAAWRSSRGETVGETMVFLVCRAAMLQPIKDGCTTFFSWSASPASDLLNSYFCHLSAGTSLATNCWPLTSDINKTPGEWWRCQTSTVRTKNSLVVK